MPLRKLPSEMPYKKLLSLKDYRPLFCVAASSTPEALFLPQEIPTGKS